MSYHRRRRARPVFARQHEHEHGDAAENAAATAEIETPQSMLTLVWSQPPTNGAPTEPGRQTNSRDAERGGDAAPCRVLTFVSEQCHTRRLAKGVRHPEQRVTRHQREERR
ncbi:MAG: hypothetical protein U5K28_08600 [Halobacteriales archaeon]|nr:hypothetical protein [Halobacteriales archaeon]